MGRKRRPPRPSPVPVSWRQLQGVVAPPILAAPKLDWGLVGDKSITYLMRHVAGSPWINQLALAAVVASAHTKLDASTVYQRLCRLHSGWRAIFAKYELTTFAKWNPEDHLVRYMNDASFSDTLHGRYTMLVSYSNVSFG